MRITWQGIETNKQVNDWLIWFGELTLCIAVIGMVFSYDMLWIRFAVFGLIVSRGGSQR